MTGTVREWLPSGALADDALVARFDTAIAAWSARWFADSGLKRAGRVQVSATPTGNWVHLGRGVWIDGEPSLSLGWRALGYDGGRPKANLADERILVAYAGRIARDLAATLAEVLGITEDADDAVPSTGLLIRLGDRRPGRMSQLLIAKSALVAPRKALCPESQRSSGQTRALSEVLGSVPITFEASLGTARASALDLRDIAPGDVIVLQRAAKDPVLLRTSGTGAVIGGAKLVLGEDGYLLKAS